MKILFYIIIFIFGTILGKISMKAIYCIPKKKNIANEKLKCPKCNHELKPSDSIPILSYIIRRGKCKYCGKKISELETIVEVLMGIVAIGIFISYNISYSNISLIALVEYICSMIFITTLVVIAGIDKTRKKVAKQVIFFGMMIGIINIIYLYITKETTLINIYKLVIYIIMICTLSIITNKHKLYKYSYLLEVLMLCIYINIFITSEVFLITAIITMISLLLSITVKKQKNKIDNSDILAENEVSLDIPIVFYLCLSTILAMIIQGVQIILI